jgi:hypothetical protein
LAEKQPRAAEIREIRNAFRQAACEVAVVDRHSGSVCWQDNGEG